MKKTADEEIRARIARVRELHRATAGKHIDDCAAEDLIDLRTLANQLADDAQALLGRIATLVGMLGVPPR